MTDAQAISLTAACATICFITVCVWFYNWGVGLRAERIETETIRAETCYKQYNSYGKLVKDYCPSIQKKEEEEQTP